MYQVGDRVIYSGCGVCRVTDQKEEKGKQYLVLQPEGQENSRFFVPVTNAAAMGKLHALPTKEEMENLLSAARDHDRPWISDENQRKQAYKDLITSVDTEGLLHTVSALYLHKAERAAEGKKCHVCDDLFLKTAENFLTGVISVVYALDSPAAKQYLVDRLK